jgi:3'-phosphoadenosine 5'-phosphosulfate sulfotransferase (PAPS reductase)/FAD synthetase
LYGDTRINRPKGREVVQRISEKTGWPLVVARYDGDETAIAILHKSFRLIPKMIERAQMLNKSYKTLFPCCSILKKKPMSDYIKTLTGKDVVLLLGLKGGDQALHRKYRMAQLRDQGTYYRLHSKNHILYYYPLRDCHQPDIERILKRFGFGDVQSSGCAICPIFCVADWRKKDPDTWHRSILMAKSLGIPLRAENQLGLEALCMSEVGA